jgi:hypothetical protein
MMNVMQGIQLSVGRMASASAFSYSSRPISVHDFAIKEKYTLTGHQVLQGSANFLKSIAMAGTVAQGAGAAAGGDAGSVASGDGAAQASATVGGDGGGGGGGGGGGNPLAVAVSAHAGALQAVSRACPSWDNRSTLAENDLCHACACQEIEEGNARAGPHRW